MGVHEMAFALHEASLKMSLNGGSFFALARAIVLVPHRSGPEFRCGVSFPGFAWEHPLLLREETVSVDITVTDLS
jgi:hypothetical protein